eukprot:scaffold104367_cov28-Tisochrysis_lutea.AAC.3
MPSGLCARARGCRQRLYARCLLAPSQLKVGVFVWPTVALANARVLVRIAVREVVLSAEARTRPYSADSEAGAAAHDLLLGDLRKTVGRVWCEEQRGGFRSARANGAASSASIMAVQSTFCLVAVSRRWRPSAPGPGFFRGTLLLAAGTGHRAMGKTTAGTNRSPDTASRLVRAVAQLARTSISLPCETHGRDTGATYSSSAASSRSPPAVVDSTSCCAASYFAMICSFSSTFKWRGRACGSVRPRAGECRARDPRTSLMRCASHQPSQPPSVCFQRA